ncbi:MAG: hypothetical protein ABSF63_02880 [Candidatus Bathyarchaeia archaeon]
MRKNSKIEYALAAINQPTTSVKLAATATSAAIVVPTLNVLTPSQVDTRSHTASSALFYEFVDILHRVVF